MSYSQKYCLVQLFESLRIGTEFSSADWPLHVTIAGVFALDWDEDLFVQFEKLIKEHSTFSSKTTSIEYFGSKQEAEVRLIKQTEKLQALHIDIANFIINHGGVFNDPQYQLEGFRPHATMRGNTPSENVNIAFTQLALVDMFPNSDHTKRRITRLFLLSQN